MFQNRGVALVRIYSPDIPSPSQGETQNSGLRTKRLTQRQSPKEKFSVSHKGPPLFVTPHKTLSLLREGVLTLSNAFRG